MLSERDLELLKKELRFYDTYDGKVKTFKPLNPGRVLMYVCGPTVYDRTHIGHIRTYVVFDVVRKLLESLGYDVKYLINFTDIDDKIIKKANSLGKHWEEIPDEYERYFLRALEWLRIKPPTHFPRATRHIQDIISHVQELISKGFAYVAKDGVYMDISKVNKVIPYGKLSKQNLEEIEKKYRIEPSPYKKNKADFAVWKVKKEKEPFWYSPFGEGRPGWHIECSVMILKHLGEQIDIHGGGLDLIFPHHENEIAQVEVLTRKRFVNFWMHVGLVTVKGEKMSKSLGNIVTLEDLKDYPPELIRFYILKTHWKKPLEFSFDTLESIKSTWRKLAGFYLNVKLKSLESGKEVEVPWIREGLMNVLKHLANNLDTPSAIKEIFELKKRVDQEVLSLEELSYLAKALDVIDQILGIFPKIEEKLLHLLREMLETRLQLRRVKQYDLADKIRNAIEKIGFKVVDKKDGYELVIT